MLQLNWKFGLSEQNIDEVIVLTSITGINYAIE